MANQIKPYYGDLANLSKILKSILYDFLLNHQRLLEVLRCLKY